MSNGLQIFSDEVAFVAAAPGVDLPAISVGVQWSEAMAMTSGHLSSGPIQANGTVTITFSKPSVVIAFSCTLNAPGPSPCYLSVSATMADGTSVSTNFTLRPGTPQFCGVQAPAAINTISFNGAGPSNVLYSIADVASMTRIAQPQIFNDSGAFAQALAYPTPDSPSAPTLQWTIGDTFTTPAPFPSQIDVIGSANVTPVTNWLFAAWGFMISANVNTSATLTITTADEAVQQQTFNLTTTKQFIGAVAGTKAISNIKLETEAEPEHVLSVTSLVTLVTDPSVNVLVYPAQTFAQLFPNTTNVDFSHGNIPSEFGAAPGPLNAQTSDGYYSPGMIVPNVSFNTTGPTNFRYFNNPPYLSFASGKGVASASAEATIVIDVSQQPALAAGVNLVELGGSRFANYVVTVAGSGWSATFNLSAPPLSQLFMGIRATRSKINTITIGRPSTDLGAFGVNAFGWV